MASSAIKELQIIIDSGVDRNSSKFKPERGETSVLKLFYDIVGIARTFVLAWGRAFPANSSLLESLENGNLIVKRTYSDKYYFQFNGKRYQIERKIIHEVDETFWCKIINIL